MADLAPPVLALALALDPELEEFLGGMMDGWMDASWIERTVECDRLLCI